MPDLHIVSLNGGGHARWWTPRFWFLAAAVLVSGLLAIFGSLLLQFLRMPLG